MTPPADLIGIAHAAAARFNLNPALVCAVIEEESSWDTYAMRFEPFFRERYVRALKLPSTEEVARSTSWGLMQVMGQVAREYGFTGRFLSEICSPAVGVEIGCAVLSKKVADAAGDVNKGLLLWNGGDDEQYSRRVLKKIPQYCQA